MQSVHIIVAQVSACRRRMRRGISFGGYKFWHYLHVKLACEVGMSILHADNAKICIPQKLSFFTCNCCMQSTPRFCMQMRLLDGGAVPDLPRAAARPHHLAVRPLVLHGMRGGAPGEGRVGDLPIV